MCIRIMKLYTCGCPQARKFTGEIEKCQDSNGKTFLCGYMIASVRYKVPQKCQQCRSEAAEAWRWTDRKENGYYAGYSEEYPRRERRDPKW